MSTKLHAIHAHPAWHGTSGAVRPIVVQANPASHGLQAASLVCPWI